MLLEAKNNVKSTVKPTYCKINSKYLIATTAAKRARVRRKHETALIENYHSAKPVGRALEEIADGKIEPVIPEEYLG